MKKKIISHEEIVKAIEDFQHKGGSIKILPEDKRNNLYGLAEENVGISSINGGVHVFNTQGPFENVRRLDRLASMMF